MPWLFRDRLPARDTALVTGAAALALSFTPSLVARRRGDQAKISAGAVLLGALAGSASEIAVMRLAERLKGGEGAARTVFAGGALVSAGLRLPAHRRSGVALAGTAAIVAGRVGNPRRGRARAPLGGTARSRGGGASCRDRRLRRGSEPSTRSNARRASSSRLAGLPGRAVWRDRSPRRRRSTSRARASSARRAAGGRDRAAARGRRTGRRSRSACSSACDAADTSTSAAALAVDELERLGAFERSRILVCCATLRGYVNPVPVQAEELFGARRRRERHRPVLGPPDARRCRSRCRSRRARTAPCWNGSASAATDDGPEIVVYGESLGAWATPERVPRRGRPRARLAARQPRSVGRDAVLLPPAAAAGRAASCRATSASACSTRATCSRRASPATPTGCGSSSSPAAPTRSSSSRASS